MIPIRTEGPAVEPVTVAALRAWLRLDDGAEDATLADLASSARRVVEEATGRAVGAGRFRLVLPAWPGGAVAVPLTPITGVDAAWLAAPDGGRTALGPGPGFPRLDPAVPDRLLFGPAPAGSAGCAVELALLAGEAEPPAPLAQAIRMLAAGWFENRGDGPSDPGLPGSVFALLAPYRRPRL